MFRVKLSSRSASDKLVSPNPLMPAGRFRYKLLLCLVICELVGAPGPGSKPWAILDAGAKEQNAEKRAAAISVLGLIPHDDMAFRMAEHALDDPNSNVSRAAVQALGEMEARSALPKIKALIPHSDAKTIVAIAAVLERFKDPEANEIYYEILTGKRKVGGSILDGIKDKKNLEKIGIEEAIGLIPYSGFATGAYNYFKQNGASSLTVDVAAAAALASDPDSASEKALVQACFGRGESVEVAALRSLAKRGDPHVISEIEPTMYDSKPLVSYTGAAAIVHLMNVRAIRR